MKIKPKVKKTAKNRLDLRVKNPDPKKNARTYEIKSLQDIVENVNPKNFEGFMKDFRGILLSVIMLRLLDKNITLEGFTWIDDWKQTKPKPPHAG